MKQGARLLAGVLAGLLLAGCGSSHVVRRASADNGPVTVSKPKYGVTTTVQRGQNLFGQGVNSGLPIEGDPNSEGMGSIIAGAVELSNTDIGRNLIDLVLATTQYRGNSRVIATAQQLLDELLNLRR